MNLEQQEAGPCTSVHRWKVDANGLVSEHPVLSARTPTATSEQRAVPAVMMISGPFAFPAARARASQLAKRHKDGASLLAVFQIDEEAGPSHEAHLRELYADFHAVVVVPCAQRERTVAGLGRALLGLGDQDQWIHCDWNDVSHILNTSRGSPVRFGCGRSTGEQRAALATLHAIAQADPHGVGLRAPRGLCVGIRTASSTLHGKEIKEVIRRLHTWASRDTTIAMSIGCDRGVPDGTLEVDIFVFGEFNDREPASCEVGSENAEISAHASRHSVWEGEDPSQDPLYALARSLVLRHQRASISLVQRHLRIGYGRASRLLSAMEGDSMFAKDGKTSMCSYFWSGLLV